jgi:uncharacterized protein YjdB
MARFAAVGALVPSLNKRSLNTILPPSGAPTGAPTDLPQRNLIARLRVAKFLWAALLVTLFCLATLSVAAQTLSPTSVAFGNWVVNTPSTTQTVKLTNTQTVPLTISSISVSGDFAQTSHCPIAPSTLGAGATCQIIVTFTPSVLGARTGTLTVNDNGSTSSQTASLSGTGVSPAALNPASLSFGNQAINTPSAAKVVTLTNYQNIPLTISGISTSGDFAQTSNCPISPNTLAARTSCTISVTFTPIAVGSRTGTLTVSDDASNSPQTASLTGSGILPVSLSPTSLSFSSQLITTTSAAKTVTLKNGQSSALTISAISTSGDFAQSSNCPLSPNTLAGGASCTISLTFTPSAPGSRTGTLSVTDNVGGSPQTAGLSGTGTLAGLSGVSITPVNPTVVMGTQQQLTATGTFPNNLFLNITDFVRWSSGTPSSAQVSSTGLVQALAQGTATITAAYGGYIGQSIVTVSPPTVTSINVTPSNPSAPAGAYQQFTAVLGYNNGSTEVSNTGVTWSSSPNNVATVNSTGLASAVSPGSASIQASMGSITGNTTLTVSQPSCTAAPPGLVGWWTGDSNTVDIAGNNSGVPQNGATYGGGEVGQAFSFNGNGASVLVNSPVYSPSAGTLMFWFLPTTSGTITGGYAGAQNRAPGFSIDPGGNLEWEFANFYEQPVGQVSPNQWNHAALTYSTSNSETTVNVYLNGVPVADAVTDVNTSWNPQIVFGAYLGAQESSFVGSMDEIAIFNQALSAQQIQQVYNAFSAGMCKPTLQTITVNPANPSLAVGLSLQFDALGSYSDGSTHDLTASSTWSTADTTVATIGASGLATAFGNGSTTVSAALGSFQGSTGLTVGPSLVSIQVNPQNPSLDTGAAQPLTATGTFSDGTQQNLTTLVSWTTSAATVATVSSTGQVTGVGAGQATITATSGSVTGSTQVTVTSATLLSITVSPGNATLATGTTQQFIATGTFSDGTQQNLSTTVSWSSSALGVATIASTGVSTAVSAGQATITATQGSVTGSANVTVTTAILVAIQVSPLSPSVVIGGNEQFSATGIYSDGTSGNVTATATWTSSVPTVATVSTVSAGLAGGTGTGEATITATLAGLSGSTTLIVQDQLTSITIAPSTFSLATGSTEQFTATGTYSSGVVQDLTSSVAWSASEPLVATLSSTGLATGLTSGQTNVNASMSNITASANLTVVTPDPLGTPSASNIVCPASSIAGSCYAVTLSCPNINTFTGYVKVTYPTGTPLGTVLFGSGGSGNALYEAFTYGNTTLNTVLQGGFTLAQISWGQPFTPNQPNGWQTGPGGIRAVACRYATLAQWIYTNIHLANTTAPFCATGNSSAAELIGQSLAHYGQSSIFAMVEPTSGPPFARQDWACDCSQQGVTNPCGTFWSYCIGVGDAQNFVDPAYAPPVSCSQEVSNHSTTYDSIFLKDSVMSPDAVLTYPNTFVKFLYGGADTNAPNHGHLFADAITTSKAEACVADAGHTIPNTLDGAQQIASDILTYCKLSSGQP